MLEPLIKRCVPLPKKLYKRTRRLRTIDEVEEYFPGFKAFIDSSEQEIPKPKNKRKRKSYYSGKKKKHTVKTQYMVNSEGTILHKTGHKRGRIHDYEVFKNKHPITPLQVENILDLGYMGVKNDFPTTVKYVVLPFRKKRKKSELSDEEKRHNRKYSKLRVIVEHTVSRIKKFGIMGTKFRNKLGRYDHASDIVSGLVNFRIMRTNGILL